MTTEALASSSAATQRTDLRRIGPLVALVVAAHALLLAIPRQPSVASGVPMPAHASLQFRVLEVQSPPPSTAAAPAATVSSQAELAPAPEAVALPAPERVAEPSPALQPEAVPVLPAAQTWLGLALPGAATDDDLYFPRSQLSVVPVAIDPVLIDYPEFKNDAGRYVAELSLFIDERGTVVRVRVDSGPLPAALEEAARRAFTQARFRPGEAAEHGVVKSRIRVEVSFDSGPR